MKPTLQLNSLTLRIPDLARSLAFYVGQLGFVVAQRDRSQATLAVSPAAAPILTLIEDRTAPSAPADAAGLFHAALLLPSRSALGGWLRVAAGRGVEFEGFSDHGVSEALYFADPDGNGLEFYSDRPVEQWPHDPAGGLQMSTAALDVQSLVASSPPSGAHPLAGARWGHLHFRVTDLGRSEAFYREALAMAVTQGSYPGARFMAADGYHHHVAVNTWGRPRRSQPAGALGLAEASFSRAAAVAPTTHLDPDGIALRITPA